METITCKECNHVNEAQRVYCHDCGARLDRAALVEEAAKPRKIARSPGASKIGGALSYLFVNLIKTALWALVGAALIEAVRPPQGVPAKADFGATIVDAPSLGIDLENAAAKPTRLVYGEAALNEYLKNRVKPKKGGAIPPSVWRFEVASVHLGQDSARLTKEFRIFNLPLFVGGVFQPKIAAGAFSPVTTGGYIGRLPVPGMIFDLVDDFVFADLKKDLAEENKALGKMKSVTVTPRGAEIISG